MTSDTEQPDIAKIHQLLLEAFTAEELDRLFRFSSNPQLQNVAQEFSPSDGLTMMADKAISYCQRHLLVPDMLAEVRLANPRQYARFLEPEHSKKEPAPSTPGPALSASDRDTLTISHPVSLLLVRVPAGEFQMGSVMARDKDAKDRELPPHTVRVPDFHIGKYPVTNLQYQAFVQATGHRAPDNWKETIPAGKENHPVVYVTWHDALAFCVWLGREAFNTLDNWLKVPTEADSGATSALSFGFGFALILSALRLRLERFPFHPLAYAVAPSWGMANLWSCVFLAWLVQQHEQHERNSHLAHVRSSSRAPRMRASVYPGVHGMQTARREIGAGSPPRGALGRPVLAKRRPRR